MSSISSTNPISNALASDYSSLLSAAAGSDSFSSIFSQAMTAAKTPQQKARVDFEAAQFSNLNTLETMSDPSSSSDSLSSIASLASLIGGNSPTPTIPAWETDLANLLGPNSAAAQAVNSEQQAAFLSQSMLNNDLSSLGSGINSVM